MPKYIAFLRAINVGGHIVKMDHLRRLFEQLGFANVETFIASGNVIFDSKSRSTTALEQKIEKFLEQELGYPVATFVRSSGELPAIAEHKAFPESELNDKGHTLYIGFMANEPSDAAKCALPALCSKVDDLHVHGREVYWLCRTKFSESQITGAQLAKVLGMATTLRNVTTVRKLAKKYS